MRDIFDDIYKHNPLDPEESVRRNMRVDLRKRFYEKTSVDESDGAFRVLLDGKPVKTPARRNLAAPSRALGASHRGRMGCAEGRDRSRQDAADAAGQFHHRWCRRCAGAGRRRDREISRLGSAVLSRRRSGRPDQGAGDALGPGGRLGPRRPRRPLHPGGRGGVRPAAGGGDRGRPRSRSRAMPGRWARCMRSRP